MSRSTVAQDAHKAEYRRLLALSGCASPCGLRVAATGDAARAYHGGWMREFAYDATVPVFDRILAWLRTQHQEQAL